MEKQYYTPEPEDLFTGYECELKDRSFPDPWQKVKLGYIREDGSYTDELSYTLYLSFYDRCDEIRTPYLSKEDVEKEGWNQTFDYGEEILSFRKNNVTILFFYKTHQLRVYFDAPLLVYNGECKSINEFRKIIKWLGIK